LTCFDVSDSHPVLEALPILGRDAEIDAIARLLDERGGALVLRGEPGIGKSTLLGTRSATR